MKQENKPIRWNVFIPCFVVIGGAALLGIVNNAWLTKVTYAMYALSGVLIAYMYFNRKKQLSVAASLNPIFGEKVTQGVWVVLVDVLSVLAIALGLASSLGAGLALIGSGLYSAYGVAQGPVVWIVLTAIITITFTIASVTGIDKGIKWLAGLTSKIFYVLLILLFVIGPTVYILNMANVGLGYWLDRFWMWGFDPSTVGGSALVTWWTMYDWAIWIAYAPLMGIFFAIIAYGRTVRQFLIVNWILPASFGFVWFSVWGSTALEWQKSGSADIIAAIWQKIVWGVSIGVIACIMVAFGGGAQGVDGVKYLAACGGFVVLIVFIFQVVSAFKVFFFDPETKKDIVDSVDQIEE